MNLHLSNWAAIEKLGFVDNHTAELPYPGFALWMPGFGAFLKRLRMDRGLQQTELADRAGVTVFTISRGERSPECPWKSSTATAILDALELDGQAPLSPEEHREYLRHARLEALAHVGRSHADRYFAEKHAADSVASTDPASQTAHAWVSRLLEEAGGTKVMAAMEALAAAWSIDLPPRVRADDLPASPVWALVHPPKRMEGRDIHIIEPAKPPKSTPPPRRPIARRKVG